MKLAVLCAALTFAATQAQGQTQEQMQPQMQVERLCNGPSFIDQMTADQAARMQAIIANTPYPEGLIWQATRQDKAITIVGTLHINAPMLPGLRATVRPFVEAADLLLVEATDADERDLLAKFAAEPDLYLITQGPTLPDLLPPDLWSDVQEAVTARGIPAFMVAQFQPWYLGLALAIPPCAAAALRGEAAGLDAMIIADAQAAGVPVTALEPFDAIITALRDPDMDVQIETLAASLPPIAVQDSLFVAMLDSYRAERTAAMWAMSVVAMDMLTDIDPARARALLDDMEQTLLIDRNSAWIPVIERATGAHDHVVAAFGAAHLPGLYGVLQLLDDAGWELRRLTAPR